jgi:hypothetical protein
VSEEIRRQRCSAFGVEFTLAAESDELLEALRICAPWGTEIVRSGAGAASEFSLVCGGGGFRAALNGETLVEAETLAAAVDALAGELMVHVAEFAPERVFVHAGVVAWRGGALVLPGGSFAGKTTLVAELVRAGAVYYSDEYAVLDGEGRVHPYPRALGMRTSNGDAQMAVSVAALGGVAGEGPLRVSHVIFAGFALGAVWNPESVSSGMAALELLRHAIPVRRTPARVMATLAAMLRGAKVLRSQRGEAKETAEAVLALMSRR